MFYCFWNPHTLFIVVESQRGEEGEGGSQYRSSTTKQLSVFLVVGLLREGVNEKNLLVADISAKRGRGVDLLSSSKSFFLKEKKLQNET